MYMSDNINSKDFMIGTLIGGLVGATVALIFAPKSGRELREDLNQGAIQVMDRANDWKDNATEKGIEFKNKAVDSTTQLTKDVADKAQEITKSVQDKIDKTNPKNETEAQAAAHQEENK